MHIDFAIQFHGFMNQILMGFGTYAWAIFGALGPALLIAVFLNQYGMPRDCTGPR